MRLVVSWHDVHRAEHAAGPTVHARRTRAPCLASAPSALSSKFGRIDKYAACACEGMPLAMQACHAQVQACVIHVRVMSTCRTVRRTIITIVLSPLSHSLCLGRQVLWRQETGTYRRRAWRLLTTEFTVLARRFRRRTEERSLESPKLLACE